MTNLQLIVICYTIIVVCSKTAMDMFVHSLLVGGFIYFIGALS